MPNPKSLFGVLFRKPHNAALIMLLTDTYLVGDAACSFVYNNRVRRDVSYEFCCTGTIVQTRTFTAWLSKEGVKLYGVPDDESCVMGTLMVGRMDYHIVVWFTGGVNIVEQALMCCMDRACFMSGTDCIALSCDESEEDEIDLAGMQELSISENPDVRSYVCKDDPKEDVKVVYMPTEERMVKAEYYSMGVWSQNAVLRKYVDHMRNVNLDVVWNHGLGNMFAENVTMLTIDDDLTAGVPALNGTMDPLAFVRGWLAQLAVGLGSVSLSNDTDKETIVSKLAYNDRGLCMICRRYPEEDVPVRWPQIRNNSDKGLAGLQELAYGVNEYFAMNISCYEKCAVPV